MAVPAVNVPEWLPRMTKNYMHINIFLPRLAVGLGAPQAINRCMYVCHRGHYEGLIRCRLVGSCVLPGGNFFT